MDQSVPESLALAVEKESMAFLDRVANLIRQMAGPSIPSSKHDSSDRFSLVEAPGLAFQVLGDLVLKRKEIYNDLLPIHKLPQDLAEDIFMYLQSDYRTWSTQHGQLMLVCKRWHKFVFNTPSTWTTLASHYPTSFNTTSLSRSNSLPLKIFCEFDFGDGQEISSATRRNQQLIQLAAGHLGRWKTADLSLKRSDGPIQLLTNPAPLLKSLKITGPMSFAAPLTAVSDLFDGQVERLEHLSLRSFGIPRDSSLFKGLRSLVLDKDGLVSTVQDLIEVVAQNPELQSLLLRDLRLTRGANEVSTSLDALQSLELRRLPLNATIYLLTSIRAPSCNIITLVPNVHGGELQSLSSFMEAIRSNMAQRLTRTAHTSQVKMTFMQGAVEWQSSWSSTTDLPLKLKLCFDNPTHEHLNLLLHFYNTVHPPATRIAVAFMGEVSLQGPEDREALRKFTEIASIEVEYLRAFAHTLIQWMGTPLESDGGGWMFPNLLALRLHYYSGELRPLRDMLEARHRCGKEGRAGPARLRNLSVWQFQTNIPDEEKRAIETYLNPCLVSWMLFSQ